MHCDIKFYINCILYTFLMLALITCVLSAKGKKRKNTKRELHWMERVHDPYHFRTHPPKFENGSEIPGWDKTPDYRVEEPPFRVTTYNPYYEYERPIRISPHTKQTFIWSKFHKWIIERKNYEYPKRLGCYCTTVYRRYTPLGGCAAITTRHILTTATSTELILGRIDKTKILQDVLGAWYDWEGKTFNSSLYMAPSRIHYHPKYMRPHEVNISTPIPCQYDLAVWAGLTTFYKHACMCSRGGPHMFEYKSSTPRFDDIAIIVGFQFIRAFKKNPMPWYKYAVRTKKHIVPCPKTEWGWFHCIQGGWAKLGLDSGASWHRALKHRYWLYDGLIGMNSFSMNLRSEELTHYFTVLNTHPVLDWLYDSYMGRVPYEYLDPRFENSWDNSPQPKWWYKKTIVNFGYQFGIEHYKKYDLPVYKR